MRYLILGVVVISLSGCMFDLQQTCVKDAAQTVQHCTTVIEHDVVCNGSCKQP